jgi:hypothetical protein
MNKAVRIIFKEILASKGIEIVLTDDFQNKTSSKWHN